MKFSFLLSAVLAAFATVATAQDAPTANTKSDLRVLYVGHDPADPLVPFKDMATERTFELYRERTGAFKEFLEAHFNHVQVVHRLDYEVEMSGDVDVTLFDARPRELAPAGEVEDPVTGMMVYRRASHLPHSFDRPALLISENSPLIGEALGLKLDWL